jgi:hypothetical protein
MSSYLLAAWTWNRYRPILQQCNIASLKSVPVYKHVPYIWSLYEARWTLHLVNESPALYQTLEVITVHSEEPPLDHILSQITPVQVIWPCFFKANCNIIHSSTDKEHRFVELKFGMHLSISCMLRFITRPSQPPSFQYANNYVKDTKEHLSTNEES